MIARDLWPLTILITLLGVPLQGFAGDRGWGAPSLGESGGAGGRSTEMGFVRCPF